MKGSTKNNVFTVKRTWTDALTVRLDDRCDVSETLWDLV